MKEISHDSVNRPETLHEDQDCYFHALPHYKSNFNLQLKVTHLKPLSVGETSFIYLFFRVSHLTSNASVTSETSFITLNKSANDTVNAWVGSSFWCCVEGDY